MYSERKVDQTERRRETGSRVEEKCTRIQALKRAERVGAEKIRRPKKVDRQRERDVLGEPIKDQNGVL